MKILVIPGSLRESSFNRSLAKTAIELAPSGYEFEFQDIKDIPLYNDDLDEDNIRPESVNNLKQKIKESGGVLLVTPEYHYSIPGVMKNVIDWVGSLPENILEGKKVGMIGVSISGFGTVRSQLHLRQVLFATESKVFDGDELYVSFARKKFDENVNLVDEETKKKLKAFLEKFAEFCKNN